MSRVSVGWNTALEAVVDAQPNADDLWLAVDERWYRRWIDPHGLLVEESESEPQRYWGAR